MFRKHYRQQIPELNTTSTADISFMLLIFFLVTSSMDTDKGLLRQMAPPAVEQQPQDINKDLVMQVVLDGKDQLTCDGELVGLGQLSDAVKAKVQVSHTDHVISVRADRATSYEAYFQVQNIIVNAYRDMREQYARKCFGRGYGRLNDEERAAVNEYYPQRISEVPMEEGGAR